MHSMLQDLRLAIRQSRQNPGFALTTILTLALGIGATTAIFSLINAVVLRPLPFPHPEQLIWAQQADLTPGVPVNTAEGVSYPDFFDWRAQSRSVSAMACYHSSGHTLTASGPPQQLSSYVVSSEFFRVLGVHPLLGRDLLLDDEKAGHGVVMLSYELWQSTFAGAREIVGRSIILDGRPHLVAGVMPPGFTFPIDNPAPALWTSLADDAEGKTPRTEQRGFDAQDVVARLKPGVSVAQARSELSLICRRLAAQYPDTNKPYSGALVEPQLEHITGDFRPVLRLLFAAVVFVLLIACANVAGLLLARASRRRSEIALRAALGAGRLRIIRQMLVESILLALCGGALGVLLSTWILAALLRFVPADLPRAAQISVDATVLAFVAFTSLITGVLFGVLPAWRISRADPSLALRDSGRSLTAGRSQQRLHSALVIAETAIGLVLLVGSGLLVRSFLRVLRVDPGFDAHHVLTARISVPLTGYSQPAKLQFYDRLLSQLSALPGIQSAAAGFPVPFAGGSAVISFDIDGRPTPPGEAPNAPLAVVTPGFFATLRIPILTGRDFDARDDSHGRPVIIINEQFARKYFPGENPIGKRIKSGLSDDITPSAMRDVIAVVGNVKRQGLTAETEPIYYLPYAQAIVTSPLICLRAAGDPTALIGPLRSEVGRMDSNIPLYRVQTLEQAVYKSAAQPRFQMLLFTCFAGMALLLAALGLFAVLSYMVVQRTQEIGVRVALGAQRSDVVTLIVNRGLRLALAGIAIGLTAAALLTRFMSRMLFGIRPLDPLTFAAVAAVLLVVSLAASSAPAWRAARLDPANTLRDQ